MNQNYNNIDLPDALDTTVREACARGARDERRRKFTRWGTVAVAACAALVVTVNVPPVSAALSRVPVLGSLVRVLQIGDGGVRTDGTTVLADTAQDGVIRLSFQKPSGLAETAPAYTVVRAEAPSRLIFTLNGVRGFDLAALETSLQTVPQVTHYYRNILLDDSAVRFTLELAPRTDYELSEYRAPGYIDLRLFAAADAAPAPMVYFLRSAAMPQGEPLALLEETYMAQHATVARTQADSFAVVVGAFGTQAEADALYAQLGSPAELYVDSCAADENPA